MGPVAAAIAAGISIALGLANFINGTIRGEMAKNAAKEIQAAIQQLNLDVTGYITWARRELEDIVAGEKIIEAGLQEILAAVNWNAIVTEIAEPVNRVTFLFGEMAGFASRSDAERKSWIDAVLSEDTGGLKFALSTIHDAIMGDSVLSTPPLLQVFAQKVQAQPGLTSSVQYFVVSYMRTLIMLQAHGYTALLNALVLNGSVDEQSQVIQQMTSRFQSQQGNFTTVVNSCSNEYSVDAMNDNWERSDGDAVFALGQVEVAPGMCIVGVKFLEDSYDIFGQSVNTHVTAVFPFIGVVPVETVIFGDTPQIAWTRFPNVDDPAKFAASSIGNVDRIDLTDMTTPADRIATGLGVRVVEGKRFSLTVRPTQPTDAGFAPGDWISNDNADKISGPMAKKDGQTFYVDTNEVVPHPLWPLSGFALYQKNNRIALKALPSSPGLTDSLFESWSKQKEKVQISVDGSWTSISLSLGWVRVPVGAVVSWYNNDAGNHLYVTVGTQQTPYIPNYTSASMTFNQAGEFPFTCSSGFFSTASGTIVVV